MCGKALQSCLILIDPMASNLPGSSVHGNFWARILEWVAISFSRGSSQPRGQTCTSCTDSWILYHWASREAWGKLGIRIKESFSPVLLSPEWITLFNRTHRMIILRSNQKLWAHRNFLLEVDIQCNMVLYCTFIRVYSLNRNACFHISNLKGMTAVFHSSDLEVRWLSMANQQRICILMHSTVKKLPSLAPELHYPKGSHKPHLAISIY